MIENSKLKIKNLLKFTVYQNNKRFKVFYFPLLMKKSNKCCI